MDDVELLEELILEFDMELGVVEQILNRPHTVFEDRIITWLDLSGLGIEHLPELIGDLQYLEVLNLSNNNLSHLPYSLLELHHLRELDLHDNPLLNLTEEFISLMEIIDIEKDKRFEIDQDTPSFVIRVRSALEKKQIESLRDAYADRRCCRMAGRLTDKFCGLCGRVVPKEFLLR